MASMTEQFSGRDGAVSPPVPAQAGIGLRPIHHSQVLAERPDVPWLEVHAENFMTRGPLADDLGLIARRYPISLHSVGLSLGSVRPIDASHLNRLVTLIDEFRPSLVSDHLAWSATDSLALPDLFPLPYTEEALTVTARNVSAVQDTLRRDLLIENPSGYFPLLSSTMSEGEFLAQLVARTGCRVLLDVNNVYVSAFNRDLDAQAALDDLVNRIAPKNFGEIHVAGHAVVLDHCGRPMRIDDHGSLVQEHVWKLFELAVRAIGPLPTLVEWDTRIPSFDLLWAEAARAQSILDRCANAEYVFSC
jgi:uncharacterized protein (UPF0276 family)